MKIVEVDDKVSIDGFEFYGHIDQKLCSECKTNFVYYEEFDSYFCPKCNRWTESRCSDPDCGYCANRPERPLPIK